MNAETEHERRQWQVHLFLPPSPAIESCKDSVRAAGMPSIVITHDHHSIGRAEIDFEFVEWIVP